MKTKRIIVNLIIVVVLIAVACLCYRNGRAYDFILDNRSYTADGESIEAMEAVHVVIDRQKPITFYADDRYQGTAIGSGAHTLTIHVLDERDVPIQGQSRRYSFTIDQISGRASLSIPLAYKNGTALR